MSEFIGSRISLVSRSDIRYVGTLHEINSETSTVALENVTSFGTGGRKNNPEEEIPPSDSVYEYIVFRGSDVKDLRIEEGPAKENKPPQVPNDPAILGSGSRPTPTQAQAPPPSRPQQQHQGPQVPPQFPQHGQYPPPFYPQPQWGRGMPMPGPGYPGMPYGAPPGWYPPPGQGFPGAGPFPYGGFPPVPPGQQFPQQPKPAPIGAATAKQPAAPGELSADKPGDSKTINKAPVTEAVGGPSKAPGKTPRKTPTPPAGQQLAPKEGTSLTKPPTTQAATIPAAKPTPAVPAAPTGPKSNRIMPAMPLQSPVATKTPLQANTGSISQAAIAPSNPVLNRAAVEDATQVATAAVAAAMAKLPPLGGGQTNGGNAMDNLTKKVQQMRTNDPVRAPRQPTGSGFGGQRGRGRGGSHQEKTKFEVPATDFDFESSNAKFNKDDLVKEAIAGSPLGEAPPNGLDEKANGEVAAPPAGGYNRASSFFDDLSSETKDRQEGDRPGGRVWRGEEQKKNLETFGQGSVDNGYRGGYRGRGRGRGGMRGRGYGGNGFQGGRSRGGYRGGRGDSQAIAQ